MTARRCLHCGRPLRRAARADAKTCSKPCRQARSRAARAALPQLSRKVITARHLTAAATSRVLADLPQGDPVPLRAESEASGRSGVVVAGSKGVRIE